MAKLKEISDKDTRRDYLQYTEGKKMGKEYEQVICRRETQMPGKKREVNKIQIFKNIRILFNTHQIHFKM